MFYEEEPENNGQKWIFDRDGSFHEKGSLETMFALSQSIYTAIVPPLPPT